MTKNKVLNKRKIQKLSDLTLTLSVSITYRHKKNREKLGYC